eukprot:CAMPEP_0119022420 /NCGR_PEP_ID=MMETSP1176-20130426/27979_1 /TAXON_ID=265551 /ORGANISM="Synedropsis recta cf, Strain CCMP1620" /LENGTH=382 /DNA_ID=CAMNT_0006977279 /DNA_START=429 /DNA_END=1577 /DNA_ORIENTATION=+
MGPNNMNWLSSETTTTVLQKSLYDLMGVTSTAGGASETSTTTTTTEGSLVGDSTTTTTTNTVNDLQRGVVVAAPMKLRSEINTHFKGRMTPEEIWRDLLSEGQELMRQQQQRTTIGIVMEVGMHRAIQCVQAARAGFDAHCFEPSPISYARVLDGIRRVHNASVTDHIHTYNVAVGSQRNGTISFLNSGSTGAHVVANNATDMDVVKVPMMRLDDVVQKVGSDVYIAKIDTQGFEPEILAGLEASLKLQKVKYILMEYWPKGMDTLASAKPDELCSLSVKVLETLALAGYTVYQLSISFHPGEPMGDKQNQHFLREGRPFDDFYANCMWFYDLEKKLPFAYHHGYWSDIFAVAPGSLLLPESPVTAFGKLLKTLHQNSSTVA